MKRNHFLDISKGICALFITVTHFAFSDATRLHLLFPFWIDMAVPVFMLISGYVATMSFRKQGVETIEQAYAWSSIVGKAVRFTVPFFMAWLVEYAYIAYASGTLALPIPYLAVHFLQGGEGAGAYYYPLMMQFILVFPLIYFLIERQGFYGLVVTFIGTYVMEVLKIVYQMGENTYCLLLFRYTFIIAVGVYLASSKYKPHTKIALGAFCAGILFLVATQYLGVGTLCINYWIKTSLFGCLYIAPMMGLGIRRLENLTFAPLELLGRASYNIFLVQKVYYSQAQRMYNLIPGERYDLLGTVVICVALGLVFYVIEQPITGAVRKWILGIMDRHPIPETWK